MYIYLVSELVFEGKLMSKKKKGSRKTKMGGFGLVWFETRSGRKDVEEEKRREEKIRAKKLPLRI